MIFAKELFDLLLPHGIGGIFLWLLGSLLTATWAVGLHKSFRQTVAKVAGPFFLPIMVLVGIPLGAFVFKLLRYATITVFRSTVLGSIPGAASLFSTLTLAGAFLFALPHLIEVLGPSMSDAIGRPFQKGHNRAHLFVGAFFLGLVVCNPVLNAATYFIPAAISLLLYLYTLFVVRPKWLEIMRDIKKGHLIEFGTLPCGREAATREDHELLREFEAELK